MASVEEYMLHLNEAADESGYGRTPATEVHRRDDLRAYTEEMDSARKP